MDFERIREKVLDKYHPGEVELEETRGKYEKISGFIEEKFSLQTHFAGSVSRRTCMKGDKDIDIFVLFPPGIDRQELEDQGLEVGKSVFNEFDGEYEIEYAEHPYTKGEINGHEVEIVPCYDVGPEDIKSAVDRTPHHSRWLEENLAEDQRKDTVVLKQFLKSDGIYGSSLKIEGFSGYLCEILVNYFGSFEDLVENSIEWTGNEVIDPEDHHGGELPEKLEEKFSEDSLVVIDPVDPERNVASVLSTENYSRFIFRSWRFLEKPGINFFENEERGYSEFELQQEMERRGDILALRFDTPEVVDDIVYPQMRKTISRLEDELRDHEFRIFESEFYIGDETWIFFELEQELPEVAVQKGPKVFHGKDHLEQFSEKYDNVFISRERLCAKTDREYTDAKQFIQDFIRKGDLEEKGIPGNIADRLREFKFSDPLDGEEKWLNYLAEKLQV